MAQKYTDLLSGILNRGAILATVLYLLKHDNLLKRRIMGISATKKDRIGARVPHEVYKTLRYAAELTGSTVNQFLVQSALKEANAIIEQEQTIRLSRRDCERFLDLLENPPKPNARLKAAMSHYKKLKGDDADSSFNWRP